MPLLWILLVAVVVAAALGSVAHRKEQRHDRVNTTEAMRQALLWYADKSHWKRRHHNGRHWANSYAAMDRGARARRALDQLVPR